MSHHWRPTVQPRAGTLQRLRDAADAGVMHGTGSTPSLPGASRMRCRHPGRSSRQVAVVSRVMSALAAKMRTHGVRGGARMARRRNAATLSANGTGTGENPPKNQVRKDGPSRVLSSLFPRVSGRTLYAMNAHTREQLADPSNAGTYRYLLSHYGPLLTLKHLAEVLHSTPNGVRMTLARRREPLSIALSQSRRRLGRRVYFDAFRVAQAIDAAVGRSFSVVRRGRCQ